METLNEVRKTTIMGLINDEQYRPMKIKEIAMILQVPKSERDEFNKAMEELVKSGTIELSEKGRYTLANIDMKVGVFTGHQKGFGFVTVEGEDSDIFIPGPHTNGALHKDTVRVKVMGAPEGKRREGEVLEVIERGMKEVVGTFEKTKDFGFVVSDNTKFNKDIFIPETATKGAVTGHKVVVEITGFGNDRRNPEGKVIEIIGHVNDPGTDIMAIVRAFEIPTEFPKPVFEQLNSIPETIFEEQYKGRKDIRTWQTVTIDGEDAKDLDDAITIKKTDEGYELGVHIADVTNYVTENSPLDKEALKRGTSVYLVDRVIPMIPHQLSNGICSLNQGVDRLALSCFMQIDMNGKVISHETCETVINVDRRMTYTSVKKILEDKDIQEMEEYKELLPMFNTMEDLAAILRKKRKQRGSLDFDFPEAKIIMENGKIKEIKAYDRNVATKIIEEFMLMANETVAEDFYWQEIPFVYRTHEVPDSEKIAKLASFIYNFGYRIKMKDEEIHPKELQKLLADIDGTTEEPIISRLTLRSMKQARYTPECGGHFGLAAKYYCHFTSPIRRYPDLQIHRIIKENLRGKFSDDRSKHYKAILGDVSKKASTTERRAEEAEREVEKLKKAEFMEQFIGEEFEGVISGITDWGFYVELPNTVEGLVHVNKMVGDFYVFDDRNYMLVGIHTRKQFRLGDRVKVKVAGIDKLQKAIDFEFVELIIVEGAERQESVLDDDFLAKMNQKKKRPEQNTAPSPRDHKPSSDKKNPFSRGDKKDGFYKSGKSKSDKSKSDWKKSDKPKSDKPKSDWAKSDKPKSDWAKSDKPKSDWKKSDKPKSDKPKSDKPKSDWKRSDKPKSDRVNSERATTGNPTSTEGATPTTRSKKKRFH
jgi:ribonuclease R